MNEETVNEYLINIGSSSYSEKDFSKKYGFYPIGNFGIGVFSTFMVSKSINVKSVRLNKNGTFDEAIDINLNINEKFVTDNYINTEDMVHEGTSITLQLSEEYQAKQSLTSDSIIDMINNIVSSEFDIDVYFNDINTPIQINSLEEIQDSSQFRRERIVIDSDLYELDIRIVPYYTTASSSVSSNGVIVSKKIDYHHRVQLISTFFNFERLVLKIKGKAELLLNTARNQFIKNEKFKELYYCINMDILNYIKENIDCFEDLISTSRYEVDHSFLENEVLKSILVKSNTKKSMTLHDIINNYQILYIENNTLPDYNNSLSSDENSISIKFKNNNNYLVSNMLEKYIYDHKIFIDRDNETFYDSYSISKKIKMNSTYSYETIYFADMNDTGVLFLLNHPSSHGFLINKNHEIGKKILALNYRFVHEIIPVYKGIRNNAEKRRLTSLDLQFINKNLEEILGNDTIQVDENYFFNIDFQG